MAAAVGSRGTCWAFKVVGWLIDKPSHHLESPTWLIQLMHIKILLSSFACTACCWSWNPCKKSTGKHSIWCSRWPSMKLVFASKQSWISLCQCTGCMTSASKCLENFFGSIQLLWLQSVARWVWLNFVYPKNWTGSSEKWQFCGFVFEPWPGENEPLMALSRTWRCRPCSCVFLEISFGQKKH